MGSYNIEYVQSDDELRDFGDNPNRDVFVIERTTSDGVERFGMISCLASTAEWLDKQINRQSAAGKKGGGTVSKKKAKSSKRNGKLGGRPKNVAKC
jgi:hypothetical protein